MEIDDRLVAVYRLPARLTNGFCFGAGVPIEFTNVDWFNGFTGMTQADVEGLLRKKKYFTPGAAYLVLVSDGSMTFQVKA